RGERACGIACRATVSAETLVEQADPDPVVALVELGDRGLGKGRGAQRPPGGEGRLRRARLECRLALGRSLAAREVDGGPDRVRQLENPIEQVEGVLRRVN